MKRPQLIYATPSPAAVADFVAARYALPGPLACTFLHRGFNDCFDLRAAEGQRFVFRLSGGRLRGEADVEAETAFLAYLDRVGVPVAAPVPTRRGTLATRMSLPQGSRPAVLFRFVTGRVPAGEPDDARRQGVTLARIHMAADAYADRDRGRYGADLDNLLHAPVSAVLALDFVTTEQRESLADMASGLTAAVLTASGLSCTRCHGDCHGGNARIATEGPFAGQAVFIDFDDGGPGYLAYDLAVYLWAQVSFQRRGFALWQAFVDGYRCVRPIAAIDYEIAHVFVPIRHIWLMGQWANRTTEWGSEALNGAWLDRELKFLRSWMRDRLSPGLLTLASAEGV